MTDTFFPADSVDTLIAQQLPGWLVEHGNIDWLIGLRRALQRQEQTTLSLERILHAIPALDEFALTRLNQALSRAGVTVADLRRCRVGVERTITLPPMAPGWPIRRHVMRSSTPLLAAGMHNFHIAETRPSPSRRGWLVDPQGRRLPIGFEVFAGRCREADVGGSYQAMLRHCLEPEDEPGASAGSAKVAVHQCFEESVQADLEVAVRCAVLKGDLDEQSYWMLLPFITAVPTVPAVTGSVALRQLYLLGKCVRGVVTLELRPAVGDPLQSVFAWIPGDPESPIGVYRSWDALFLALARRLTGGAYRRFFSRFISERDRVGFHQTLDERVEACPPGKTPELDGRHLAIDTPLFTHVRQLQIDKMYDDARVLATPTEEVDQQERDARLQAYRELGLNLLNLAGLFIPVLGEALLTVTAVELAGEVYEGYQDWRIGDRQGALDHVFSVAQTVVAGVLIAKGGTAVRHYLERVPFVDELHPVCKGAGRIRLAAADLPGYPVSWNRGDDLHEWMWHLDGAMYRVSEDPAQGSTRIRHASRGEAWQPRLESNGGEGWRHELERPDEWEGAGQLVRRVSARLAKVADETAEHLLQITGLSEAQLRRLHLEQCDAPARLYDALDLYWTHERFPDLAGSALERQIADSLPEHGNNLLVKTFPGLSRRQVGELMSQCNGEELEQLMARGRMPLSLAERARWQLRERRLDRACAGLCLPRAVNADSERLAMGLVSERISWSSTFRLELRHDSEEGALLASAGRQDADQTRYILRRSEGYRLSHASGRSHSLQRALWLSLEDTQLAQLEEGGLSEDALGKWLLRMSANDRAQAANWCGMQPLHSAYRPPLRLGDGRLGYSLSGRGGGSRQAIRRGIQQIFPTLGDDELQAYLLAVDAQHTGLWAHYMQLQEHLGQLRSSLRQWRRAAGNPLQGVRRRRLETALRRCWRRKITNVAGEYVLDFDGEHIGRLPQLPQGVRFDHVKRLFLRNLGLAEIDEDFLQRFGNLVELDLSRNRLSTIPAGLEGMSQLRSLRLSRNQIELDVAGERRLQRMRNLQLLDLSRNPLGRAPVLTQLRHLRDVRLRSTGLEQMPEPVSRRAWVDLRDNRIRQLRQDLQQLRLQVEDHALHDNPLDEASEAALEQVRGEAQAGPSRRHRPVDDAVFEQLAGAAEQSQRDRWRATYHALQEEQGASDLLRFVADFVHGEDFAQAPARYRSRIWRILEFCERHEAVRVRLFAEAGGQRTCEDRLLLTLEQLELGVLVEKAVSAEPGSALEARLWRLGRSLWRLDEVDRIAVRHIERLRAEQTLGVDEIEVRLYYRLKLSSTLDLPLEYDDMHYPGFAHVNSSDLLRARDQVLANETPELVTEALAQRPFWESHAREYHPARFEEALQPLHVRMDTLEEQVAAGQIDDWTFALRCQALKYEYEQVERHLLRTLAQELRARLDG